MNETMKVFFPHLEMAQEVEIVEGGYRMIEKLTDKEKQLRKDIHKSMYAHLPSRNKREIQSGK